ncbi:hypothetical protein D3C72_1699840 [compost metagenome]
MPGVDREAKAPAELCGWPPPDSRSIKVPTAVVTLFTTDWLKLPSPVAASANGTPQFGAPTAVTDATRSGRTPAT